MKLVSGLAFFVIFLFIFFSCTRDMVMEVEGDCNEIITYDDHIRRIVNNNCAYSGCHSGAAPGVFTNYEGMSAFFEGDELERRVVIQRNMPPNYATGPKELSEEDIELFKCWVDAGYPEN